MEYEATFILGNMLNKEADFTDAFCKLAAIRNYPSGYCLIEQGANSNRLIVLLKGIVECNFISEHGNKKTIYIHTGNCFIGASALEGKASQTGYTCLTEVCVATMPVHEISKWNSQMLLSLARLQKQRERTLSRQLLMRTYNSTEERIMTVLEDAKMAKTSAVSNIEFPQDMITLQTLSDIVGATKVQVNKIIQNKLNDKSIGIDCQRNFYLLDRHGSDLHE